MKTTSDSLRQRFGRYEPYRAIEHDCCCEATKEHRDSGGNRNGAGWYVSARHGRWLDREGSLTWQPFGVHHARRAGERLTRCGIEAVGWELFWELPFLESNLLNACPECYRQLMRIALRSSAG